MALAHPTAARSAATTLSLGSPEPRHLSLSRLTRPPSHLFSLNGRPVSNGSDPSGRLPRLRSASLTAMALALLSPLPHTSSINLTRPVSNGSDPSGLLPLGHSPAPSLRLSSRPLAGPTPHLFSLSATSPFRPDPDLTRFFLFRPVSTGSDLLGPVSTGSDPFQPYRTRPWPPSTRPLASAISAASFSSLSSRI